MNSTWDLTKKRQTRGLPLSKPNLKRKVDHTQIKNGLFGLQPTTNLILRRPSAIDPKFWLIFIY